MTFVAARSDEYTATLRSWSDPNVRTQTQYYNDGRVIKSQTAASVEVHRVIRWGHSNNKQQLIPGTTTTWRPPSAYTRQVLDIEWDDGTLVQETPTADPHGLYKTVVESKYPSGSASNFKCPPIFMNGGFQEDSNIKNQVLTEALLKLADSKAQLGAALGEARKTADMLADGFITLLTLYRQAKHGNLASYFKRRLSRRGAAELNRRALELIYGWLPLMQDIKGTYDLLTERLKPAMILSGERHVSDHATSTMGSCSRTHSCKLYAQPNMTFIRQASRLGLTNPLSIAWELVPFSFVLDWGLPVGNVLQSLDAASGLSFVGGYWSVHAEGKLTVQETLSPGWRAEAPRSGRLEGIHTRRYVVGGFPRALPYAKNPFTSSHISNAVSLWMQRHLW